jgi:hypothetical protein
MKARNIVSRDRKYILLDLNAKKDEQFVYSNRATDQDMVVGMSALISGLALNAEAKGIIPAEIAIDTLISDLRVKSSDVVKNIKKAAGK